MQEAGGELLVSRIVVQTDLPYRAMRVDLACAGGPVDADEATPSSALAVQAVRAEQIAEWAESLGASGLLLRGDGSMLGRSGLRRGLRHLRAAMRGWIGLVTRGPEPADLQAVLEDGLLDFVDVQLSWEEVDEATGQTVIRTGPSMMGLRSVLCRSSGRCVVRFVSPAGGEAFQKISSVFDAFVRSSAEPVAVRVFETVPHAPVAAGRCEQEEMMEFVACRPAWMLEDAAGEWMQMQNNPPLRWAGGR